ncbi:MAG: carbon-nitrogen hydrolase family protein [Paraglaciecola sp.]|uniref:carbon-nitrogen hydrolase family protein n=1 Tax=Paraglaciecola sp. TaxID=1920173 RepID=UPI00273DFF6A|nr:carbon-nitrogen hydrolase family protein [Paraglaciecola sp.]MDP5029686.1 carbon-nitrogen hydrolase family protein [Paraglaciecola sp.]MDP5131602.1 carbon-nitrogen hydrolase family protein [Paraglaciecola sp.]
MAKLVAVQMTSSPVVADNLRFVEQQLQQLEVNEPTLVVLPECFACFGAGDKAILGIAETPHDGPVQTQLCALAKKYGIWLVAGSFPLKCATSDKYTASSLLIDDLGHVQAEYQKIHLFDVQVADNTGSYLESRTTEAGRNVVVVDTPFGKLGLAICYDIRFAGLFQAMSQLAQLDMLALPAAFTQLTGQAHWHALITARAIENQCYLIAANQTGEHANQRQTYGHSSIISPWGETLAQLATETGTISTIIDTQALATIRRNMPIAQHNKFRSYLV